MSNTVRAKQKVYSIEKYRKAAVKAPFPLELDDGKTVFISRPTGDTMLDIAEKFSGGSQADATGIREVLSMLLGEHYDEVMQVVGPEDFGVMLALINDLMEYFELGEAVASLSS